MLCWSGGEGVNMCGLSEVLHLEFAMNNSMLFDMCRCVSHVYAKEIDPQELEGRQVRFFE